MTTTQTAPQPHTTCAAIEAEAAALYLLPANEGRRDSLAADLYVAYTTAGYRITES